jgi:hypothetical protein
MRCLLAFLCVCLSGQAWAAPPEHEAIADEPELFRFAYIGIRDEHEPFVDVPAIEAAVGAAAQHWSGFNVSTPTQVAANVGEVNRLLLLTSTDASHALAPLASSLNADFALMGAVRASDGHPLLRLRLIHLPDAEERWSGERPVDALPLLLMAARNRLYLAANERNTHTLAVVAHTPPENIVEGVPVTLEANALCRGAFNIDLFYRHVGPASLSSDAVWSSTLLAFDAATGAYKATLPGFPLGRLQYYFWMSDESLTRLGQAGSEALPYDVAVTAPERAAQVLPPISPIPPISPPPPVAVARTGSPRRISLTTKVVLGLAGAALATGLSMGFASHALHIGNLTEVQAYNQCQ